jgi:hypothetical protein
MILDSRGAIIEGANSVAQSVVGQDYIVVWDTQGMAIHINRSVVDYLCGAMYGGTPNEKIIPANNQQQEEHPIELSELFVK